jgi:hypothetical protein
VNDTVLAGDDVRLLHEIGMLGAGAGASALNSTEQIFRALMLLRPQRDFGYIGMACAYINQQRPDEAVQVLEKGLLVMKSSAPAAEAEDMAMVQVFLALGLLMSRRTAEAVALLQKLIKTTEHPPALRMARGLLGLPVNEPFTQESA